MHKANSDSSSPQQLAELSKGNESGETLKASVNSTKNEEINSSESSKLGDIEAWIRYCIEWRDLEDEFKSRHEVTRHDFDMSNPERGSRRPTFERVAVYRIKSSPKAESSSQFGGRDQDEARPIPGWLPSYYIRIYSLAIINALRSVVQYYPGQDLSGDFIQIEWPYPILVHHYSKLCSFREAVAKKEPHELCVRERDVDKHLGLLLGFLDTEVMESVKAEQERNNRGCFTFDYLWVALEPGRTILHTAIQIEEGGFQPGVIHSVSGGTFGQSRKHWQIKLWSMEYNGVYLGCVSRVLNMLKFDGESTTLKDRVVFINDEDLADDNKDERVRTAVEQGKSYWNLVEKQCRYHQGATAEFPTNEVEGMVMVDLDSFYSETRRKIAKERKDQPSLPRSPLDQIPMLMDGSDHRDTVSDCPCHICSSSKNEKVQATAIFDQYDKITRKFNRILTNHQYFLCAKQIHAFVFKTRTWEKVYVRNLSPPRFYKYMIDSLVIDDARLKTLKSLTGSLSRLDRHGRVLLEKLWAADYVDGKGNGLIFLLHGGPGVGKTFTAECIANFLERPLMVLRTTDIGARPEDVEENLARNFKIAKNWNAVLLIDEADVFVANRTIEDLHRSSLVASFLHALEFYDGLLFLTTNRVGTFDDAILSRVHIQMFYPDLNAEQRYTVWSNFIHKLEVERPSMQVKYAVKEYLRSSEMKDFEMNGREIRNAFQTAVALAEHRAEEGEGGKTLLTEEHLREVIELGRSFKKYFCDLHGSEGKRAYHRGERLDSLISVLEEDY